MRLSNLDSRLIFFPCKIIQNILNNAEQSRRKDNLLRKDLL